MTNITREEIEKQITGEMAIVIRQSPDTVKSGMLLRDLGVDSMAFVEILVFVEKQYGLKLIETGMQREDFATIRSLSECIERELKEHKE